MSGITQKLTQRAVLIFEHLVFETIAGKYNNLQLTVRTQNEGRHKVIFSVIKL